MPDNRRVMRGSWTGIRRALRDRLRGQGPGPDTWSEDATPADVYYAYRYLLRRAPDRQGFESHQRRIQEGISFGRFAREFGDLQEVRNLARDDARPTVVDFGDYQVCVQRLDTDFAQMITASRDYEPHVRRAVAARLRSGDVMVDVGANVGCIALMAAQIVGASGVVVAVEPNPDNVQMLYAGIVINGLSNVRIFPYAASSRSTVFSLGGGRSNSRVVPPVDPRGTQVPTYVESIMLDEALGFLPRVDLVKMDIEGHEPRAFAGFRRVIERDRPTLVVEWNPWCLQEQGEEPATVLEEILELYPEVRAISAFGDDNVFTTPARLVEYWHERNEELLGNGTLACPLHFDVIAERRRRVP